MKKINIKGEPQRLQVKYIIIRIIIIIIIIRIIMINV